MEKIIENLCLICFISGDNIVACLRYNVSKMLDRHALTFNGMMSRLQLNQRTDLKLGFNKVLFVVIEMIKLVTTIQ